MNGRSPFRSDWHLVFLPTEELALLPFFIFWKDALSAGGADAEESEPAAQKVHALHLQNLQWLPFLASLQKPLQDSYGKSPFRLEEQAFLGVVLSEARTHASRHRQAAQPRRICTLPCEPGVDDGGARARR